MPLEMMSIDMPLRSCGHGAIARAIQSSRRRTSRFFDADNGTVQRRTEGSSDDCMSTSAAKSKSEKLGLSGITSEPSVLVQSINRRWQPRE
jgi:hypothetical protein